MLNLLKRKVYLDHNATTPVSCSVRKTMNRVLKRHWGNPSSGYQSGKVANQIIEHARGQVAKAINAHAHETYFTGCATESNNAVLQTLSNHFYPGKKKIISSPIEHPSIANTLEFLKTKGLIVEYCSVDKFGFASAKEIAKLIDNDTFLICCMLANNEIGSIQNIAEISALAQKNNILTLSDCVQAFGKIPIDVKALGVDYATFSAHKLYGPKGVGALYARISSPLAPFIHGGHQEEGMRAGTESVHNIAGFGKACNDVPRLLSRAHRIKQLKELLMEQLRSAVPDIIINSPFENCLPNTISATIPNTSSKELMMLLDYYGISVSAGSACSTHQNKPSRVLKSIGLSDKAAKETLRISLGIHTRKNDIAYTLKIIKKHFASKGKTGS